MDHQSVAQMLGNYGEFFGAIAVLVTLIYLASQVRQNATQMRLNSFQHATERFSGVIKTICSDPDLMMMWRDGLASFDELPPERQAQFHAYLVDGLTAYQNCQQLADAGVIPEHVAADRKRDMARLFKCTGAKQWRKSLVLEPESLAIMDALIAEFLKDTDAVPLNEGLVFFRKSPHAVA
ncbi:MAG: hypothetical protein OEU92_17425 [Alphaproteobacteria bacterium]|nr:hypothetical protein [Alphaproteobacteria bacterium]